MENGTVQSAAPLAEQPISNQMTKPTTTTSNGEAAAAAAADGPPMESSDSKEKPEDAAAAAAAAAAAPSNTAHERPPKPVPLGSGAAAVNNSNGDGDVVDNKEGTRRQRTSSEGSRGDFRRELAKRRQSLTTQEHGFLDWLAVHGDELEIATAREKLSDETLFFDLSSATPGLPIRSSIHINSRHSSVSSINNGSINGATTNTDFEIKAAISQLKDNAAATRFDSSSSVGSNKRLEALEARRKSDLPRKMWKAHENGLAVTNGASRKSVVLRRERSMRRLSQSKKIEMVRTSSFLSTTTQDLLLEGGPTHRPGEDEIFRSSLSTVHLTSPRNSVRSISIGDLPSKKSILASLSKTGGRLRRYSSAETNRKSVTFKDHPLSDDEEAGISKVSPKQSRRRLSLPVSIPKPGGQTTDRAVSELSMDSLPPPIQHAHAIRSDSMSSIPSLHHARPIRADSMSSIPSLHHARPIRADSMSSIPSLHHGRPIRADSMSSIPSLHRAHPLRSDSIASLSLALTPISPRSSYDGGAMDGSRRSSQELDEIKQSDSSDPAWMAPLPKKLDVPTTGQVLLRHPAQTARGKPVLLRKASVNTYEGEGIEASEWNDTDSSPSFLIDSVENSRMYRSMISMGSVYTASSFDETKSVERFHQIFRGIDKALSDDDESYFMGSRRGSVTGNTTSSVEELRPEEDDGESWDLESEHGRLDAWHVLKDEYATDFGIHELPFRILGTSADDVASHPHVLSPPLLESLQSFFPYSVSEDNFWMKFSMIRDGASLHTLLQKVRGSRHTIVAIETADGEVFGSFTSATWRKNWNYFGTGESFLWHMRQSRSTFPSQSIIDLAQTESELDVYPWAGENNCIQLCTHDKIAVGSGAQDDKDTSFGFGLAIDADLIHGSSSPCSTFASPPLARQVPPGERFEIMNLEVWALTPCATVQDAQKLELGKLFLEVP